MTDMSMADASGRLGLSLRQIDHWARQGYIDVPSFGAGVRRPITEEQFALMELIKLLNDAGFTVAGAARVARRARRDVDWHGIVLTDRVSITIHKEEAA